MPWKVRELMEQRRLFISRLLEGESMTTLCREYGISRKTGYKFLRRFQAAGPDGLADYRKIPHEIPHRTPPQTIELILKLRELKPLWGPKKLKAKLEELHPKLSFPATSTIGDIIKKHGYILSKKRNRRSPFIATGLTPSTRANQVWCVDFKGQFRLGDGTLCYPLTVTDHFSRYILACEALDSTQLAGTLEAFTTVFREYGLPDIIRSDNGTPFSGNGLLRLSQLSAWWVTLGIRPERIEPGHPEQNGRHERMHLTLKREVARRPAKNLLQQQEHFDEFRREFNEERPHEALAMKTPASAYEPSLRRMKKIRPVLEYPDCDLEKRVYRQGIIRLSTKENDFCFIGRAFAGQTLGLKRITSDFYRVKFASLELGYIDCKERVLTPEMPTLMSE